MAVGRREIDDCGGAAEEGADGDLPPTLVSDEAVIVGSCLKKSLASRSYVSQGTLRDAQARSGSKGRTGWTSS